MSTMPTPSERLYRALLGMYPARFRARYADEMTRLFVDQLREARADGGATTTTGTWLRAVPDMVGSAISEHRDDGRRFGHSLESPSGLTRFLGLAGIVGGAFLLAAFVVDIAPEVDVARLPLYYLGALAIIVAVHRRQAGARPVRAWSVALAAMTMNVLMFVLGFGIVGEHPFAGSFGWIYFGAGLAMWIADVAFGAVALSLGTVNRFGALALTVGSVLAIGGMDRLELVRGEFGWLIGPAALTGIALNGLAWVVLGVDEALRRRPTRAALSAA